MMTSIIFRFIAPLWRWWRHLFSGLLRRYFDDDVICFQAYCVTMTMMTSSISGLLRHRTGRRIWRSGDENKGGEERRRVHFERAENVDYQWWPRQLVFRPGQNGYGSGDISRQGVQWLHRGRGFSWCHQRQEGQTYWWKNYEFGGISRQLNRLTSENNL